MSALNPSRNTTRVQAPPGGHSTISFGGETPLSPGKLAVTESATPSKAVTPPEDPVAVFADAEVLEVEAPAPVEDSPSLETLKLQAIGAIAGATDVPDVREAMAYLIKVCRLAICRTKSCLANSIFLFVATAKCSRRKGGKVRCVDRT